MSSEIASYNGAGGIAWQEWFAVGGSVGSGGDGSLRCANNEFDRAALPEIPDGPLTCAGPFERTGPDIMAVTREVARG